MLSDPTLRKKYNEFGPKDGAPEGGYVDPEEVFGTIFGGERFVPIIGDISLGKDMKEALQEADDTLDEPRSSTSRRDSKGQKILSPEEKAKKEEKERRVSAEVSALVGRPACAKVALRAESASEGGESAEACGNTGEEVKYIHRVSNQHQRSRCRTKLARNMYAGSRVCNSRLAMVSTTEQHNSEISSRNHMASSYFTLLVSYIVPRASKFVPKSSTERTLRQSILRHYLASTQSFMGVGGWLHNVQGKYHVFSET